MSRSPLGVLRTWVYAADRRLYRWGLRDRSALTLPQFLAIGAVKSATTWLHHNLLAHPDVCMPTGTKEVHYFDTRYQMPLRWYAAHFESGGGRVVGEVCPTYLALPEHRIRVVRELLPDVRLVALLRHPVERAWSQVVMDLERHLERPLESVTDDEIEELLRTHRNVRHAEYVAGLRRWWSAFPRDRLLVLYFDDVVQRPRELLAACFRHIGVTDDVDWSAFPVDENRNARARGRRPSARIEAVLRELHQPRVAALRELLGDAVPASW